MIGLGPTIGTTIFLLVGPGYAITGPSLVLAFGLNFVVTMFTAMAYMELGSAFPETGGGYLWIRRSMRDPWGFLGGWMSWFGHCIVASFHIYGFGLGIVVALKALLNVPSLALVGLHVHRHRRLRDHRTDGRGSEESGEEHPPRPLPRDRLLHTDFRPRRLRRDRHLRRLFCGTELVLPPAAGLPGGRDGEQQRDRGDREGDHAVRPPDYRVRRGPRSPGGPELPHLLVEPRRLRHGPGRRPAARPRAAPRTEADAPHLDRGLRPHHRPHHAHAGHQHGRRERGHHVPPPVPHVELRL